MSWTSSVYVEIRAGVAEGQGEWQELCRVFLDQAEGLGLYDLTGLQGADPPYEILDASRRVADHYAGALQDTASTKLLRIEGQNSPDLDAHAAKWRRPPTARLRAALDMLRCLGARGRLLFWIDA